MLPKLRVKRDGIITDGSGRTNGSTLKCCHCGGHFEVVRGSGRKRGFCMKCMDVTCMEPACVTQCVPEEKYLLQREALAEQRAKAGVGPPAPPPDLRRTAGGIMVP